MRLHQTVAIILGLLLLLFGAAQAATPANTLVIAKNIDDIITLDPGEAYEASDGEIITNIYDRLIRYEATDFRSLVGGVAERWTVSEDGRTFTFKIRPGLKFQSGNPVTAEDAAFSLQRVVLLDKTPAFLLTQFGWTKDNVAQNIKAQDASTLVLTVPTDFAPTLVLNAISTTASAVVDKKEALQHSVGDDLGNNWLKNHSAGSGAFNLRSWTPNESVVLDANPNFHLGAPKLARVIVRHVPEATAQRLLLEKGDVDIARNLTGDQLKGINSDEISILTEESVDSFYVALNQSEAHLANPKVREAMRWAIDYQGMVDSFLKGQAAIHQTFLPSGFWASLDDNPYRLDISKAKALLAEAGYPNGFDISMDAFNSEPWSSIAQSLQSTMNQVGIRISILSAEQKQVWTKYRARQHQMLLIQWSPDYLDPHTNADAFCRNTDDSDASKSRTVAWRSHWFVPELTKLSDEASRQKDATERKANYVDLQKKLLTDGAFLFMFVPTYEIAMRKNVKDFIVGPYTDLVFYRLTTK
jgi:peptide/nickel transport system substrate-binding protein